MTAHPVASRATNAKLLVAVRCAVGGGIHHGLVIAGLVIGLGLGLGLHIIVPLYVLFGL